MGIKPLNKEQQDLFNVLNDESKQVVAVTGPAGTGKSLILGAYCLQEILKNETTKLIISKPMEIVGSSKFFGTVPGDVDDKFAPFLLNFKYLFQKLAGNKKGKPTFETLKHKGRIEFLPIELMRGVSFGPDTIVYLDECQNIDEHMIKTLGTRVEDGCRLLLSGDLGQVDVRHTPGIINVLKNKKFIDSNLTGHVNLTKIERGPVAELFARIFE